MLESLYTFVSDDNFKDEDNSVIWLDDCFKPLTDILTEKVAWFNTPKYKSMNYPVMNIPSKEKEITVCFSGGKDSAAVALYYKRLGYKVHLYHMKGINKAYGNEVKAAVEIAQYLDCDLFVDKVYLSGFQPFIEHPMKNYMIASGAIHYALAMGYGPKIAFGNFSNSHIDMEPFDVCGGDCIEMWDAFEHIIQSIIPNFSVEIPLFCNADTFDILVEDWGLFERAISCMSPYRFREHWKHRTEQKYGIKLMQNRCGGCWKCAMESMWLMDHGHVEYDEPYYLHCMEILCTTIKKEMRLHVEDVESVWNQYMFYPITESKAYEKLQNLRFTSIANVSMRLKEKKKDGSVSSRKTNKARQLIE